MKRVILIVFAAIAFVSCNDKPVLISDSAGKMNDILVVIEDDLWDGVVGDSIRKVLAAPVDVLVRPEPQFTLNQVKPAAFNGMLRKSRNYLRVDISDNQPADVKVTTNLHANPQKGVVLHGSSNEDVINQVIEKSDLIRKVFKEHEIQEKQRLIDRVALNVDRIKEKLGVTIKAPQAYRYAALDDPEFFWLRRNIREGTMDLMLFEVPRSSIPADDNVVASVVRVRDSIGALKIPVDEGGVFQTEYQFSPFLNESEVNGVFAYETKGLWEVKNKFMSGPFLNYAIYNEKRDSWIIAEGYIYAPSADQRNYLFELEAILKSIRFVE